MNTLAYPKAVLSCFCLALLAYHAVSVIKAALRAVHGRETVEPEISGYYLALEISQTYDGMMMAIPPARWQMFRTLTPTELAKVLKDLAAHVDLHRYQKHPRGPKKPPPEKSRYKNGRHVATKQLIDVRD